MSGFALRTSKPSQDAIKLPRVKLVIKHPGYPDEFGQNDLLSFYAWDTEEGGLHASTVLLACGLVACNEFDGYLTSDRHGMQRVHCDHDSILPPGFYYFHVPIPTDQSSDYKYPVYPSFSNWAFPHRTLPKDWRSSSSDNATDQIGVSDFASAKSVSAISGAVIARDKSCTISGDRDFLERAHLCPRSETEWFQTNGMNRYNGQLELSGDIATDDMANAIALRTDIHKAFDQGYFMIARKKERWVSHFLRTTHDLGRKYHRLPLDINPNVASEFLLVRFAWAMFPLVRSFLESGGERLIKVRQKTDTGVVEVQKTVSKEEVAALFAKDHSRGRSASPKKRKPDALIEECYSVKRQCCGRDSPIVGLSFSGNSDNDLSEPQELDYLGPQQHFDTEDERRRWMKRLALQKQRPSDPRLICCDYSAAENANARGVPGLPEYGGGHLCERCLGVEIQDDLG